MAPLNPRPYFRLFVDLLHDFNPFDPQLAWPSTRCSRRRCHHSPLPGWSSSPTGYFMPALLLAKQQKDWILMHKLLMDLSSFMEPFLRKAELNDPTRVLYKGTFEGALGIAARLPGVPVRRPLQLLRCHPTNMHLAFPRKLRLPDPFTPKLKVDLLSEISQPKHAGNSKPKASGDRCCWWRAWSLGEGPAGRRGAAANHRWGDQAGD